MGRKKIDLTGKVFGRLTVISENPVRNSFGAVRWNCICECDKTTIVIGCQLVSGNTRSCGCLQIESTKKRTRSGKQGVHGMSSTPEHQVWVNIRQICYNKNHYEYSKYGGEGVIVCDRWKRSFENFYKDVGSRPSRKHIFVRKENVGNYEPGNCEWVLRVERVTNKARVTLYDYLGEKLRLSEISRRTGIEYGTLYARVNRYNMPISEAVAKAL